MRSRNPSGPKPYVWRGYKNCDRCTCWRPVSDYSVYFSRTGFEQIRNVCDHCKREKERIRYHNLSPAQKRARGKKANKLNRKRRDKALADIERQRKILDRQNRRIKAMEDRLERHRRSHMPVKRTINGNPAVDIIPFRMWLLRQYRERGYDLATLADKMGEQPSKVRHWLDGFYWNGAGRDPVPVRSIDLYKVDKVAVKLGDPGLLERLYPLELDEDL